MNSEMSYVVQCASVEDDNTSASLLSRLQEFSQHSNAQSVHQKITVSISVSVGASDGEGHAISADWKSSDLHIDFASGVSTNNLILNSELECKCSSKCIQCRYPHGSVEFDRQ